MEWLKQFARLFGWKNRQYETLTEANVAGLKLRIWSTSPTLQAAEAFDHAALKSQMERLAAEWHPSKLHGELMKLPNVACVAIVDGNGNGVSGYPDWH